MFAVKVTETVSDCLSCEITCNEDRTKAWLGQPHMIKRIETTFGDKVKGSKEATTPGTPGRQVIRTKDEERLLELEKQSEYRTGVGMLLFLVKHSRPDIANAIRELSKCLGVATQEAMDELYRIIKFVLKTKTYGLHNLADGLTKNVVADIYRKHVEEFVSDGTKIK